MERPTLLDAGFQEKPLGAEEISASILMTTTMQSFGSVSVWWRRRFDLGVPLDVEVRETEWEQQIEIGGILEEEC